MDSFGSPIYRMSGAPLAARARLFALLLRR
jgi:hypothetical protein